MSFSSFPSLGTGLERWWEGSKVIFYFHGCGAVVAACGSKSPRQLRDTAGLPRAGLALGKAKISKTLRCPQKDGIGLWAHLTKPIHKYKGLPTYYKIVKVRGVYQHGAHVPHRCPFDASQCWIKGVTLMYVLQFRNTLFKTLLQKLNQWDLCSHKLYSYSLHSGLYVRFLYSYSTS